MDYNLEQVIKKRLRQIDKTWTWLADTLDVSRSTLTTQTASFERLSLEQIREISNALDFNLMEDYLVFLRSTRSEKQNLFLLGEPKEEYVPEEVPVWFCLKATPDIYDVNFMDMMQEIRRIGSEKGFKVV
jgi:hypothetical protein